MNEPSQTLPNHLLDDYIIAPHEICDACSQPSGPRFARTTMQEQTSLLNSRNNVYLPSNEREAFVTSSVIEFQAEKGGLDEEIKRVQKSLDMLLERRRQLDRYECSQKSLFSPVRRLPPELLERIFLLCRDMESVVEGYQKPTHLYGIIDGEKYNCLLRVIPSVSYYWNMIANSCPLLWSRFYVGDWYHYQEDTRMISFLKKCIRNSGRALITMHLTCEAYKLDKDCLIMLSQNIHRWEDIFISGDILVKLKSYLPENPSFPCLKSISVCRLNTTFSFKLAPLLTSFEAFDVYRIDEVFPNFPWLQITDLSIDGDLHVGGVPKFINHISSLKLCGGVDITQSLTLPHLRQLELHRFYHNEDGSVDHSDALIHLVTPGLKTLRMDDLPSANILRPFLDHCYGSLEDLTLTQLVPRDIAENLTEVKHLNILCLCKSDDLRLLIRATGGHNSDLFPKLETLCVDIEESYRSERDTMPLLFSMIRSRLRPRHNLQPDESLVSVSYLRSVDLKFSLCFAEITEYIKSDDIIQSGVEITYLDPPYDDVVF